MGPMNILHAVVYGIVEGLTEFLPVSSTGHLILAARLLGETPSDFLTSFEIAIQLGAIGAVIALYWRRLFCEVEVAKRVLAAFLPTAAVGFVLYKVIKQYLLSNDTVVLWALFLGGVLLIVFELFHRKKEGGGETDLARLPYGQAVWIGVCQSLAVVPGVSRSAATILGGLAAGLSRKAVVEFSFLLAVPTLLAATALDLAKNAGSFSKDQFVVLGVGGAVSFVVAFAAIRFFLRFVQDHTFMPFGIYRIGVALVFWFVLK